MRLLALDLATRTGWASFDGTRRESGYVEFDVKRGESPGMRYIRFNRWLDEIVLSGESPRRPHYDLIVIEQGWGRMKNGAAAQVALGLLTRVEEFCARHGLDHVPVNGSTLKKWTTGRGNADKTAMIAAVSNRFLNGERLSTLDDNEADALALLEYARAVIVPKEAA